MTIENKNSELENTSTLGAGLNAVLKMLQYAFVILSFGITGLLIWFLTFGGAFTVEEQERILVMNFGELSEKVYGPGWHWNWPYPISETVSIPVSRQSIITKAFQFYIDPTRPPDPNQPMPVTPLIPGRGGYLFTGDTNIIHSSWGMFYHVSDPYKYYITCMGPANPIDGDNITTGSETKHKLGTRGPQTVIQAIFENAIIEATSKENVDFTLKSPLYRETVEKAVKVAIDKANIGITVEKLWLEQRTPPLAVAQAFSAVFDASNFSFSEREKAKSYATKMKNLAASESVSLIAHAEAYRTRVVARIKADTIYFKAMLKEYKKNPNIVLVSRYSDVLGDVLALAEDKFIIRTNPNGKQEIRILLNREPKKKKNQEGRK